VKDEEFDETPKETRRLFVFFAAFSSGTNKLFPLVAWLSLVWRAGRFAPRLRWPKGWISRNTPFEKVGLFYMKEGKLAVIEYSDLLLASNPLVLETSRREGFASIKNATGEDPSLSSYVALFARARNWPRRSGIDEGCYECEVSTTFQTSSSEFSESWHRRRKGFGLQQSLILAQKHLFPMLDPKGIRP
jgi:hypothetical protein